MGESAAAEGASEVALDAVEEEAAVALHGGVVELVHKQGHHEQQQDEDEVEVGPAVADEDEGVGHGEGLVVGRVPLQRVHFTLTQVPAVQSHPDSIPFQQVHQLHPPPHRAQSVQRHLERHGQKREAEDVGPRRPVHFEELFHLRLHLRLVSAGLV